MTNEQAASSKQQAGADESAPVDAEVVDAEVVEEDVRDAEVVEDGDGVHDASSTAAADEPAKDGGGDQDPLAAAVRERDEYLALAQRARADFENFRRRAAAQTAEAEQRGRATLARNLLPAIDNLQRALTAAGIDPESAESAEDGLGKGVALVYNELIAALERDGVAHQTGVRRGKGAGKPATVYALHPAAESYFSRAYQPVLAAVLDVLVAELSAEQAAEILDKVGRRLGASAGAPAGGTLAERAEAAAAALRALGGEVELVANEAGALVLRGTGCPLSSAVTSRPETCRAVESFVSEVVGAPVRECCSRDGRPRCCFTVQPAA
jgi:molecular chaperone GrpE